MKRRRRPGPSEHTLFPAEPAPGPMPELDELWVLNSDEELVAWERGRIAQGLVREAGVEPARAGAIAARIEQQVRATSMRVVPASLLRELAGAELVALGLAAERVRHSRLGISLYDAGRILRGSDEDGAGAADGPFDPIRSSLRLAERLKREYALAAVLGAPVADAHRRGRLHVRDLEAIDRPERVSIALGPVLAGARPASPDASALAEPVAALVTRLTPVVARELELVGLDAWLSPGLGSLAPRAAAAAARSALDRLGESACHARGVGGARVAATLELEPGPELTALLAAVAEGAGSGLDLVLRIGPAFFRAPGHRAALEWAAEAVRAGAAIRLAFERGPEATAEPERPRKRSAPPAPVPGVRAVLGSVFLDLPRLALEVGPDEEAIEARLIALLALAARAQVERRVFLEELLARGPRGPLAALAEAVPGGPLLSVEAASHALVVTGLAELVEAVSGRAMRPSEAARSLAHRLLARAARHVEALARKHRLRFRLGAEPDAGVAGRFARLDLRDHGPRAAELLRGAVAGGAMCYTPGVGLPAGARVAPLRRLSWEGELQALAPLGARSVLSLREVGGSARETAGLIMEAWLEGHAREISFRA